MQAEAQQEEQHDENLGDAVEEAHHDDDAVAEEDADDAPDVGGPPREKMYRRAVRKEFLDKLLTSAMMEIVVFGTTAMDAVYLLLVLIFHRLLRDKKAHPRPVGWPENEYRCCHYACLMILSRSEFRHLEVSAFTSEAEWNAFNAAHKQQGKPTKENPAAGALSAEVLKWAIANHNRWILIKREMMNIFHPEWVGYLASHQRHTPLIISRVRALTLFCRRKCL
jgi:hypothetical protein